AAGGALVVAGAGHVRSETDTLPAAIVIGCAPLAAPRRGAASVSSSLAAAQGAGVSAMLVPVIETEHLTEAMRRLLEFRRTMQGPSMAAAVSDRAGQWRRATRAGVV